MRRRIADIQISWFKDRNYFFVSQRAAKLTQKPQRFMQAMKVFFNRYPFVSQSRNYFFWIASS